MIKPYRDPFVDKLMYTTPMHPSTWLFAWFTKNPDSAILITGFCLSFLCVFNAVGGTMFTIWLGLVGIVWFVYLLTVAARSYKILKKNYNEYLFPIELAFNSMSAKDQRKYSSILKDAYIICARRNYDEFSELTKIRELFELSVDNKKAVSLDAELQLKKVVVEEKEASDKIVQEVLDTLERNARKNGY